MTVLGNPLAAFPNSGLQAPEWLETGSDTPAEGHGWAPDRVRWLRYRYEPGLAGYSTAAAYGVSPGPAALTPVLMRNGFFPLPVKDARIRKIDSRPAGLE